MTNPCSGYLALLATLVFLSGCGLFGSDEDDFTGLDRGTFRMEANGERLSGSVTLLRRSDSLQGGPSLRLAAEGGSRLVISDAALDSPEPGVRFEPDFAVYTEVRQGGDDSRYVHGSGEVEITASEAGRVEGTFSFEMSEATFSIIGGERDVEGGFNAVLAEPSSE